MAKSTEWTISKPAADRELAFAYSIRRPDGWAVAEVCHWPNDAGHTARLIAAAPAMRELLAEVACYCPVSAQDAIRALLATIDGTHPIADTNGNLQDATREDCDEPEGGGDQ